MTQDDRLCTTCPLTVTAVGLANVVFVEDFFQDYIYETGVSGLAARVLNAPFERDVDIVIMKYAMAI